MNEIGDCVITRLDTGRLRVDRADPRIRIGAELLDEIKAGNHHPDVHLDGDLLYIDAVNQRVIYRIGEKDPERFCYFAAWPD